VADCDWIGRRERGNIGRVGGQARSY